MPCPHFIATSTHRLLTHGDCFDPNLGMGRKGGVSFLSRLKHTSLANFIDLSSLKKGGGRGIELLYTMRNTEGDYGERRTYRKSSKILFSFFICLIMSN